MKSTELTTLEDQQRLLERDKVEADRARAIRVRRDETIRHDLSKVLLDATKKTRLREHAFKSDEELTALGLKPHQKAIVRQWEQAKRNAAFAIESSSRQIEAHLRGQAEKQTVKINVENATIQIPEKRPETTAPVIIEVIPDGEK